MLTRLMARRDSCRSSVQDDPATADANHVADEAVENDNADSVEEDLEAKAESGEESEHSTDKFEEV